MMKCIRMKVMAFALVMAVALAEPLTVPFIGNIAVAEAATVKISESKVTMEVGATTTLKVTGTKSKVTWKSSNKKVVTVTSKGVVTAKSEGTAKITATVNKKNYTCTVTVIPVGNPYRTSLDQQEIHMADLCFVVPGIYEVSGEETKESYIADLTIPDSLSSIKVIAEKTGKKATSYKELKSSLSDVSQEVIQESMDVTYGVGAVKVSDFNTFEYEAKNGLKSFAYSFMYDDGTNPCRTISYHLSIDNYSIQIITTDVEGYDVYAHAEYLIDSLIYHE